MLIFFFTTKTIKPRDFPPEYRMFFPNFINPPITNVPPLYKRIIIFPGDSCVVTLRHTKIQKDFARIKDARKTWGGVV